MQLLSNQNHEIVLVVSTDCDGERIQLSMVFNMADKTSSLLRKITKIFVLKVRRASLHTK